MAAIDDLSEFSMRQYFDRLDELLWVTIYAVISGAEGWTAVIEGREMKFDWLCRKLPDANGIASHRTFERVFSLLDATRGG